MTRITPFSILGLLVYLHVIYDALIEKNWILFLSPLPPFSLNTPGLAVEQGCYRPVVRLVLTQGDAGQFTECKNNHWTINDRQKEAISKVSSGHTVLTHGDSKALSNSNCSIRMSTGDAALFMAAPCLCSLSSAHPLSVVICWIGAAVKVCLGCGISCRVALTYRLSRILVITNQRVLLYKHFDFLCTAILWKHLKALHPCSLFSRDTPAPPTHTHTTPTASTEIMIFYYIRPFNVLEL